MQLNLYNINYIYIKIISISLNLFLRTVMSPTGRIYIVKINKNKIMVLLRDSKCYA